MYSRRFKMIQMFVRTTRPTNVCMTYIEIVALSVELMLTVIVKLLSPAFCGKQSV